MTTHNQKSTRYENERILAGPNTNAWQGQVRWNPAKSAWISGMTLAGVYAVFASFTLENLLVFLTTSGLTICLGHSLGMHRRFIHNSYQCPKWMEYLFVYLGVLVGMAGPIGMMYTHDTRDWAQRQGRCHDYFGHGSPFFKDAFWQMHCDIHLSNPPRFQPEAVIAGDRFYRFVEQTWMWQQAPVAALLFLLGGIDWVLWGVCLRVAVSVTGHWLIGYFAHNSGHRQWHVEGAAVQGFNIRFCGLITMGECWHNNHHAYPNSALLGIHNNQMDPGWWVLSFLRKLGLVWGVKLPQDLPERLELTEIDSESETRAEHRGDDSPIG